MFKVGDTVVTKPCLWHDGVDIGERLAEVISIKGHILIEVLQYERNPVKVFRSDIEECSKSEDLEDLSDIDVESLLDEFFPHLHTP